MDTALLRTFWEVAAQGSVTAAAQSLGYTQSAVSRQVAALETALDVRLFDREARGVRLTDHGRLLLPHATSVLERLDDARRELEELDRAETGRLRVGAFPTAVAVLIPRALAAFESEHPKVALSLVEGITRRQLARLRAGDADVAVVSGFPGKRPGGDEVELEHLLDDPMLVALPRSHRLAGRRRVRLAELADESWIAAEASADSPLLGPATLQPESEFRVDYVVGEWTAKLGLVAAGLGITLLPSLAVEGTRSDLALVPLSSGDGRPRGVYAATPRGVTRSPSTDAFIRVLKAKAKELRGR